MDNSQLAQILQKRIALLPGGRDRRGGSVIVVPSQGDIIDQPYPDVVACLGYLARLPDEATRARGFTLLVDMRHAWIRYLRTVLKAIQHVLYGKVRQTIIVKPEQFLDKQRIIIDLKLEVYEFKISLVSVHKLGRHLDVGQLPAMVGGSMPYDHAKWLDLRMRFESFQSEASTAVSTNKREDSPGPMPSPQSSSSDSLEFPAGGLAARGQALLDDLNREAHGPGSNVVNPDMKAWADTVQSLLQQLQGKQERADSLVFEKDKTQREHTEKVVYEQFVMGVNNVSDWLLGPGEKWLLSVREIGESTDEADQLRRDHDQLSSKALEIQGQAGELGAIADELLALNHPQSAEIRRKRDHLRTITGAFLDRVRAQSRIVLASLGFHASIDQFTTKLDDMLENLCSEVTALDAGSTQSAIEALDSRVLAIDKAYEAVLEEGDRFEALLTDYLPGVVHVRHSLAYLGDRRSRSQEMADVRRLKLQQMLQLYTCENDGLQAVDWLSDLCDTLLTHGARLGTSLDEAASMRRDHHRLEQTAKSTYEYGRQLVHISSVLRRSLRFEMGPNLQLAQRLDEAWSRFCRALGEHSSRVNLSQAFYQSIRQVTDRLDHLCGRIGGGGEHSPAGLLRLHRQRREVAGDVNELRHIGQALIARIEHPIDSKESAHANRSVVEDIRQRLDEADRKLRAVDSVQLATDNQSTLLRHHSRSDLGHST